MKIYKISENVEEYQWLMPNNEGDLISKLSFDCDSKAQEWSTPEMHVFNPKKTKGNFYSLGGIGVLVVDEKAKDILLDVFELAGEVLPLNNDGEILYAVNVLECTNALNQEKTHWHYYENGQKGRILQYSFHKDRLTESSLFKIPETSKADILTYSGIKDKDDEFFHLYHRYNLSGLLFEEIYSD